ncbi:hypothetical protein N665_0395s0022 [Sinapis alba]|nr:hypothetical protein N665_0395s0022 [Sinapis alba]
MRACKFERFPISLGIFPVNWLLSRLKSVRLTKVPIDTGIEPLNRFKPAIKIWRCTKSPKHSGIVPVKLLFSNPTNSKDLVLQNASGTSPVNKLSLRSRYTIFLSLQISDGIEPEK